MAEWLTDLEFHYLALIYVDVGQDPAYGKIYARSSAWPIVKSLSQTSEMGPHPSHILSSNMTNCIAVISNRIKIV